MKIKSIKQVNNLANKVVLLRTDFNVPVRAGRIRESYKIVKALPTIKYLMRKQARIVIISHFGRPEITKQGKVKNKKDFSLKLVSKKLQSLLRKKIIFCSELVGEKVQEKIGKLQPGQVLLLENLRFFPGELKNDSRFARRLAQGCDLYINDAFSVSHRQQASLVAIKKYLPSYAGLLLEEELENIAKAQQGKKPFVVIIGGAKMKTKTELIKRFSKQADYVLIGGAIANNFFKAQKLEVGKSLVSKEGVRMAKKLLNKKIILPVDVVVAKTKKYRKIKVKKVTAVQKTDIILDIGPETMKQYAQYIKLAQTIIWNGPMGKFEVNHFQHGTLFIARIIASRSQGKAFGLVGGGETVEALRQTKMFADLDWVSTGGGALLSYLGKKKMPGLKKIIK